VFVKPDCLIPGSFPNSLVYLRGKHRVKKTAGYACGSDSAYGFDQVVTHSFGSLATN